LPGSIGRPRAAVPPDEGNGIAFINGRKPGPAKELEVYPPCGGEAIYQLTDEIGLSLLATESFQG